MSDTVAYVGPIDIYTMFWTVLTLFVISKYTISIKKESMRFYYDC